MEPVTRRGFFKQAGAAAAVVAVAGGAAAAPMGVAGALARRARPETELAPHEQLGTHQELVAHVKNARTGEISLFIDHREVTLHDRKLAARLVRATR